MCAFNYHQKKFRSVQNAANGEVSGETLFAYFQEGSIVWASYAGGDIVQGHLIATCNAAGDLDMRYHHVNQAGVLMTGRCYSRPERLPDGRIRLYESWQWTSGNGSAGHSIIEEVVE